MSYQSINADKWDALVAWLQKTKNEEDTDIYAFLDECLGVSASGEEKPTKSDWKEIHEYFNRVVKHHGCLTGLPPKERWQTHPYEEDEDNWEYSGKDGLWLNNGEPECRMCGRQGYSMACRECDICGKFNGVGGGDCECICED